MSDRGLSGTVAGYWDENRYKSKDPAFWMAHPLCREAINRRVSGSPGEWPLDWFKRVYCQAPFGRGVSWGCGLGAFERSAIRCGVVREIDAFDISPKSLEDARQEAAKEGLSGIHYGVGNFDDPRLVFGRYDIAFFHASLHHVSRLERLFARLRRGLAPGGAVYVDEYVGPSRTDWSFELLQTAQDVLDGLPKGAKIHSKIELPIEPNDPSEAVRSSEIRPFLRRHVDLIEWRPYGGQIVDVVLPCVYKEWADSTEGHASIRQMLDLEDRQLEVDPEATHHLVAYGTLREAGSRVGILARLRDLLSRLRR
jgi:SAM-dependent methyltransferase